jgi:hypothetical protein
VVARFAGAERAEVLAELTHRLWLGARVVLTDDVVAAERVAHTVAAVLDARLADGGGVR